MAIRCSETSTNNYYCFIDRVPPLSFRCRYRYTRLQPLPSSPLTTTATVTRSLSRPLPRTSIVSVAITPDYGRHRRRYSQLQPFPFLLPTRTTATAAVIPDNYRHIYRYPPGLEPLHRCRYPLLRPPRFPLPRTSTATVSVTPGYNRYRSRFPASTTAARSVTATTDCCHAHPPPLPPLLPW